MGISLWLYVSVMLVAFKQDVTDSAQVKERTTSSMQNIACQFPWQRVVLTDAYYIQSLPHCDRSCQPTSPQDPPRRCFEDYGKHCRSRFTLQWLNHIYRVLKSGKETELSEAGEKLEGDYRVKYVCLAENASDTVNPCGKDARKMNSPGERATSLLVMPATESRPCKKLCRLVNPPGQKSLEFDINFLTQDGAHKNYLEYSFCDQEGKVVKHNITSSYQAGRKLFTDEVKVRIIVEDVSQITRLWLKLKGHNSSLTCEDDRENIEAGGTSSSATQEPDHNSGHNSSLTCEEDRENIEAGGTDSSATQEPDHNSEQGDSLMPYIIGFTVGVLVIIASVGVGLFIYCIRKRHSGEENGCGQPTPISALSPAADSYDVILHDGNIFNVLRDQHVTPDDRSYADTPNQTGRGSDDDQYGRLAHYRRSQAPSANDHSDIYDHATSSHPSTSSPNEDDASQQENDVYGRLHRHPGRQNVVDNVYDSTR